ncbi:uncharacterized protein LOC131842642 [Achroia grisella]|uniref:uncharacterized protein LOC131842642 n=1 Tax=Achroia grisella TaxID=688607 RepID=UPI0027D1FE31|nr:uncharacterized protein LOC131842642 [Achroia grisella]
MAVDIAHSIFYNNSVTAVVWCQNNCDDVTMFLSKFQGVTYSAQLKNDSNIREVKLILDYKQAVIFISKPNEFQIYLTLIYEIMVVSIRIILVIMYEETKLIEIMNMAWKYGITDIFVLSMKENKGRVSTYFPYSNGICGNTVPVLLNNITDIKLSLTNKFKNFQGCPIRFTLIYYDPYIKYEADIVNGTIKTVTGLEAPIPLLLSYMLNASLEFLPASLNLNVETTSNSQFFLNLLENRSDISVPATLLNLERYQLAQSSFAYKILKIYWIGPPQRKIETWAKMLHIFFNNYISLCFCVTFFIFVVVTTVISRCNILDIKAKNNILINSYSIFIGHEAKFETKSAIVNSLFIMWIYFCIVLRLVLQGNLTSDLQNTPLEPPWTSMDYAINQVEGYGGGLMFKNVFKGTRIENNYKGFDRDESYNCLKRIAKGHKFIMLADKMSVDLNIRANFQYIGVSNFTIYTYYYMRPGWPAAPRISKLIQKIFEVGFIVKSNKDNEYTNILKFNIHDNSPVVQNPEPLGLDDFKGFFKLKLL